jgi:hypothetical protein
MGDIESWSNAEPNSYQISRLMQQNYGWARGLLEKGGLNQAAGWAQYVLERYFPADDGSRTLPMLLFATSAIDAQDYRNQTPLTYMDSGMDVLLDRTSWSSSASQLVFTAGWGGLDHKHADAGHFQLFRKGAWISNESFGYQGVIESGGGHNTILLQTHDSRQQYSYTNANTQKILRASANSAHSYAAADLRGAYDSPYYNFDAYNLVQRSILWLKSNGDSADTIVLFDQVHNKAGTGNLTRKVRLHLNSAASISGRNATSDNFAGTEGQRTEIRSVLPASSNLQYLPPVSGASPGGYPGNYHTHRVDIDPGTNTQNVALVTVMRTSDISGFAPVSTSAIETIEVAGTVIDAEAVVFARTSLLYAPGTTPVSFNVPATVQRVWFAGLKANASYSVQVSNQGGSNLLTISQGSGVSTDDGGLLAFTLAGSQVSSTY